MNYVSQFFVDGVVSSATLPAHSCMSMVGCLIPHVRLLYGLGPSRATVTQQYSNHTQAFRRRRENAWYTHAFNLNMLCYSDDV